MNWKDPAIAKILLLTFAAVLGYGATMFTPPEYRDGDLIFQATAGRQSAAILAATGSPFTHMGIVRLRDGKPLVVEAIGPVQETPLDAWISRGEGRRYALYRVRDLSPADSTCSELPHLAFSAIGRDIGAMTPLRRLNISDAAVTALIERRWQKHPACKSASTMAECVQLIQDQPIVTPASIAADKDVELVYSDF
jgi:hypothetical protein